MNAKEETSLKIHHELSKVTLEKYSLVLPAYRILQLAKPEARKLFGDRIDENWDIEISLFGDRCDVVATKRPPE